MSRTKVFLMIVVFGIVIITGFYVKKKFYDPKQRLSDATEQVDELTYKNEIQEGDLIFQISLSQQSKAIQLATHSKYSHCGIIYKNGNEFFVFEAVQPVKHTSLNKWIAKGQDGHFVLKRLKDHENVLTKEVIEAMKHTSDKFKNKNYDIHFEWSDDKIYCSELIWKIYQRTIGIEIGKLEKLQDFDLTSDVVKQKMKERYGDNIPLDEQVISPASIFDSYLLMTVKSN